MDLDAIEEDKRVRERKRFRECDRYRNEREAEGICRKKKKKMEVGELERK